MPNSKEFALAVMLAVAAPVCQAAPTPEPSVPVRTDAGVSALPLNAALGTFREVPSVALVLGAGTGVKLAALDPGRAGWIGPATGSAVDLQPLAILLSVVALTGLGAVRRQTVYRWIVRR